METGEVKTLTLALEGSLVPNYNNILVHMSVNITYSNILVPNYNNM